MNCLRFDSVLTEYFAVGSDKILGDVAVRFLLGLLSGFPGGFD